MSEAIQEELLRRVRSNRREFVKKLIAGAAFATPLLASFSMEGLTVSAFPQSSNLSNQIPPAACSNQSLFSAPLEYDGPREFQAYFLDRSNQTRMNGEATFTISAPGGDNENDDHPVQTVRLDTELTISKGSVIVSAHILVNGQPVATFNAGKGSIFPSTVQDLCDFTELLETMASDQASVAITAANQGPNFILSGPIKSVLGKTIRVLP